MTLKEQMIQQAADNKSFIRTNQEYLQADAYYQTVLKMYGSNTGVFVFDTITNSMNPVIEEAKKIRDDIFRNHK